MQRRRFEIAGNKVSQVGCEQRMCKVKFVLRFIYLLILCGHTDC